MQDNSWSTPSIQDTHYVQSSYNYPNNYVPATGGLTPAPSLMPLSQPNTPRPDMPSSSSHRVDSATTSPTPGRTGPTSPDVSDQRHFGDYSSPYPTSPTRRRRAESSMFAFEAGPSFSSTKQLLDLWNMDQTNGYQLHLHVKMDRGFFRAEQDWTCYRRNYFQVSATFDVHGMNYVLQGSEVPCLVQSDRQLHQVDFFSIGVSARVSGAEKKIDLIQHTPKRDKGPQMVPLPRMIRAGGNLHLAPVGSNHNIVSFERMQFKTATANNGKRRAAQQYYEIVVDLFANTSSGLTMPVATCTSAPLVVRGRSPGHYADYNSRYRASMGGVSHPLVPPPNPALPANPSSSNAAGLPHPPANLTAPPPPHYLTSSHGVVPVDNRYAPAVAPFGYYHPAPDSSSQQPQSYYPPVLSPTTPRPTSATAPDYALLTNPSDPSPAPSRAHDNDPNDLYKSTPDKSYFSSSYHPYPVPDNVKSEPYAPPSLDSHTNAGRSTE
ncbi:p53-like transcription factor [Hesseltinella vesiculosa]|uniref:p53-like transcription factor n=1 Tax=Hesseltinella vesiculosa TaxID=101127 RepID=A0A1X2GUJ8_9FUNG|nr:p53-like transcription factor [Hesseltinella vesiculosa]